MKVYLDNCCYNRPYDNQMQMRIYLEAQAKLYIQNLIVERKVELVSSYILVYENSVNPHSVRKGTIEKFMERASIYDVSHTEAERVKLMADEIIATGVKVKDAYHIACAIYSGADYFISTDDRLLKYRTDKICMTDPIKFVMEWEDGNND